MSGPVDPVYAEVVAENERLLHNAINRQEEIAALHAENERLRVLVDAALAGIGRMNWAATSRGDHEVVEATAKLRDLIAAHLDIGGEDDGGEEVMGNG